MPADTCEGIFAPPLWDWIMGRYRLDAVITFASEATPFPRVDTNAIIFCIRQAAPEERFAWARCMVAGTPHLYAWAQMGFAPTADFAPDIVIQARDTREALVTGLSRAPRRELQTAAMATLLDYATVTRGVATGANEYFFLTRAQVVASGIPSEYFIRAVGRTRDALADVITPETLEALDAQGRPTYVLALDGRALSAYPDAVRRYVAAGEQLGLPVRPLIATRRPWYKMETRTPPPLLFAYLGRRQARFIRNEAGVVPLTGFLCVYPRSQDPADIEWLWAALRRPDTVANLALVGKSYGAGAIKVEPRSLERLPIPAHALAKGGMGGDLAAQLARLR
jgi:hypothetical protein